MPRVRACGGGCGGGFGGGVIRRIGPVCFVWNHVSPKGVRGWGVGVEGPGYGIVYVGGQQVNIVAADWVFAVGLPLERWTPWYTDKNGRKRRAFGPFALSKELPPEPK